MSRMTEMEHFASLFLKFFGFLFHALENSCPAVTSFTGLPSFHPIYTIFGVIITH